VKKTLLGAAAAIVVAAVSSRSTANHPSDSVH